MGKMVHKIDDRLEEMKKIDRIYRNTYEHMVVDPRDHQPDLLRIKKIFYIFDEMVDLMEKHNLIQFKESFLLNLNSMVGGNYDEHIKNVTNRDR